MYLYIYKRFTSFVTGSFYSAFRGFKSSAVLIPSVLLTLFVSACASISVQNVQTVPIDRFPAYQASEEDKTPPDAIDSIVREKDILALSPEIKALLDSKVASISDFKVRLAVLKEMLFKKVRCESEDDLYDVKTASEVFETGTGNCLSFSNLVVAAARYAGLEAEYVEISTSPTWTREGEVLYISRHIGASVSIPGVSRELIQLKLSRNNTATASSQITDGFLISDFDMMPVNAINSVKADPISDSRAFAQHYNNMGSRLLVKDKAASAYLYFSKALETDPELSFAWANIGVAYRISGQYKAAEDAYLQGLAVTYGSNDSSRLTLFNNLMSLYERTGDIEKAELYRTSLLKLRRRNPYYKYKEANTAYDNEQYEEAAKQYRYAIALKKDEHLFYYGLACAYLKLGDIAKAQKNLNKAIQYSWNDNKRKYYKEALDKMTNNGMTFKQALVTQSMIDSMQNNGRTTH